MRDKGTFSAKGPRLLLLTLFLSQRCDLAPNFAGIRVKAQCHGVAARQNNHLRQFRVVAQRLGEARAAGENFHLTHLPRNFQNDDGHSAQGLCGLLPRPQRGRGHPAAGEAFLLRSPCRCWFDMDDALVTACLLACLEDGEALAGLMIPPDQQGGAISQVQQPADLGLAKPWSIKNKAHGC